jgi:hypothetical protein
LSRIFIAYCLASRKRRSSSLASFISLLVAVLSSNSSLSTSGMMPGEILGETNLPPDGAVMISDAPISRLPKSGEPSLRTVE